MGRRIGWFALLAGGAAVLLALLLRSWGFWMTGGTPQEAAASYPPDALANYIPPDAGAVLSFDLRGLRAAPVTRGRLGQSLRRLVSRGENELPWLALAGIDPWEGVEQARVVLPAGEASQPLWLVHGRIDPDRFQIGPSKLVAHAAGPFQFYEYLDPIAGQTYLAAAGETLVVATRKARLIQALNFAMGTGAVEVQDATLRALLNKTDRTQPIWLAASLKALGPVGKFDNAALNLVLPPILRRARTVHGGLRANGDLKAEFTFEARDEADAMALEKVLGEVVTLSQGAELLPGKDESLALLFELLGTGEIERDGTTVKLRCRLAVESQP
jgi:hypothetical protein